MYCHPVPSTRRSGFTLIEMSVVLAVIGLLVGGVLLGRGLLRNSELQGLTMEFAKLRKAYFDFRDQYGGLPGDMIDATEFWGTDAVTGGCGAPAPVAADRVPKTATCNGNGDGWITAGVREHFRVWQHMANAGFIEGTFSGVEGPGGVHDSVPGQNSPVPSMSGTAFFLEMFGDYNAANADYFAMPKTNVITFGRDTGSWPRDTALTPREQYAMDQKADDGMPATGSFRAFKGFNPNCTTATPTYNLTEKGRVCGIMYFPR